MELEIVAKSDSFTQVALRGRLDTAGVDRIEARFSAALARAAHGVVDLSQVSFLASLGVRMLLTTAKMLARRGAKLVLVAPQELVHEALRFSSIDEILPVVPDLAAARAALGLEP